MGLGGLALAPQGHEMANMLDKILKKSMPAKRETH